jgi:oxygen-independent coproporphyrinogen III oxidase
VATPPARSELRKSRAAPGTPLYVHLPFCAAKCHYCDFFSVAAEGHDRGALLDALLEEARRFAPRAPRTLFFGGGTPSLLEGHELVRLLEELERLCGWRASASEITLECNPESLDREKAALLLEQGVNRLSIGFQSLDPATLQLFGRVHGVEQSFAAFEAARSAGFENLNLDLIYAIPDQELERWEQDLTRILALEPEHVSAYNLTFEEETLFRKWMEEGRLKPQPEERELEFFWRTRARLAEAGLDAYEISNFSRSGKECLHNLNYWHNGEYVGIGPSAVSKIGNRRLGNVKGIQGYARRIAEGPDALVFGEEPEALARLGETWWLGLRLHSGLSPEEARRRSALPEEFEDPMGPVVERLLAQGLLERQAGRLRLSQAGLPLADYVARQFLAAAG